MLKIERRRVVIKIGSVIREYKYGTYIESTVISYPIKNERGQLEFKSETKSGRVIEYMKHESGFTIVENNQ